METAVSHEKEMEGGSGKLRVMAQQSRVGPRGSDRKNPSEESLTVAMDQAQEETMQQRHAEEPMPEFYLCLPPEYREKLMKHNAARAAAMNKLLLGHKKLLESKRSEDSAENELGKRLEMMRIIGPETETQIYEEIRSIQRALRGIEYKLTNKKNRKTDKETLQLLRDMSNKLHMLDQPSNDDETDEIEYNRGKKTVAEEMAEEEERFDSYRRLWEYKRGESCGLFKDTSKQLTNPNRWLIMSYLFIYINGRGSLFLLETSESDQCT
jgi:hypothetical protein